MARPRQSRWSNRPVCTVPSLQRHDLAPVELHSCVGSHLLVHNHNHAHAGPEACLVHTFRPSVAILFKSGFDTNMDPFAYMPQSTLPYSTKQGHQCLGSRQSQRLPTHTAHAPSSTMTCMHFVLPSAFSGTNMPFSRAARAPCSSLLSRQRVKRGWDHHSTSRDARDYARALPCGKCKFDHRQSARTGFCVPGGRGMVALLALVDCVLARLPTTGKTPAGPGGA